MPRIGPAQPLCRAAAILSLLLLSASTGQGALIDQLQITSDGSSNPPGYVATANVFRTAAESKAAVTVRAFLIVGQRQETALPVQAAGQQNRDAKGNLAVRVELPQIKESGWSEVRCVIPYADLQLNNGTHKLGFELTVWVDDKPALTAASELVRVKVTDGARASMKIPKVQLTDAGPAQRRSFFEGDGKAANPNAEVVLRNSEVTERKPRQEIRLEEVVVRIPGGFERVPLNEGSEANQPGDPTRAAQPGAPSGDVASPEQRTLFYATNRRPKTVDKRPAPTVAVNDTATAEQVSSAAAASVPQFSVDEDDRVHYGSCQVSIPVRHHKKGQIELPTWWSRTDNNKVFYIASGQTLDAGKFSAAIGKDDVVLFVHGFANTFDDAVFRAAQVAYDTGYAGRAVVFSWPSCGDINKYVDDQARADRSEPMLVEVLRTLQGQAAEGATPRRVHIIAHSMGNRLLLKALYELRQGGAAGSAVRPFGQIVLAAPDVSAGTFNLLVNYAIDSCEQLTYYFCPQDLALKVSQEKNRYEPVGLYPYFQKGLVTIDAESANTSFLGHSYFAEAEPLLLDINLLFGQGLPPAQRKPPLAGAEVLFGHQYWTFGAK